MRTRLIGGNRASEAPGSQKALLYRRAFELLFYRTSQA